MIHYLDNSKICQKGNIPIKITTDNRDLFSEFLTASFNDAQDKGVFPDQSKHVHVKSIRTKVSRNNKENYRPISILPN